MGSFPEPPRWCPLPPMITAPSWLTDVFFWFGGICQDTKGSEVNLVKQCVKYGKSYLDLHHRKQETPKMEGWQMIFLWKGVTFRFHIGLFWEYLQYIQLSSWILPKNNYFEALRCSKLVKWGHLTGEEWT